MNPKGTLIILLLSFIYSQGTHIDSTSIKDPTLSWRLSLIPGLGQIYNGNLHKSFIINSMLCLSFIEMKSNEKSIDKRNTWAWWIFGIYVLGILDAYVDAHLTSFPIKKNSKMK